MKNDIVGLAIAILGIGIVLTKVRRSIKTYAGKFLRMKWGLPTLLFSVWLITVVIALINKNYC